MWASILSKQAAKFWPFGKEEKTEPIPDAMDVSARLMRLILGSISLEDVKTRPPMDEGEREHYERTIAAFYPNVVGPALDRLIAAQEQLMARGSEELRRVVGPASDQVIFGRGTINGLELAREEFKEAYDAYVARLSERGERFDPHKMFPELFDNKDEK